MRTAVCSLTSVTPYSQSFPVQSKKKASETDDEFDQRCWKEHCHVNGKGKIFIPPMAFKNALDEAAKRANRKIPGRGNSTYTKFFTSGVSVVDGLELPLTLDDVEPERLFLNSDGVRGSGKRVWRTYPLIREWAGDVEYLILDDSIPEDLFEEFLRSGGMFIGIGRFRPENRGFYGRFKVEAVKWQ